MNQQDFEILTGLVKERSGIVLTKEKSYLLESRLLPLARKRGMSGLDDLVAAIRSKRDEPLIVAVTEAMTTNESSFFRDIRPFDIFRKVVLPEMLEARATKRAIRIWCAACSTGQEPYTLAICLREEAAKLAGWRTEIIGTDLSKEVLEKARVGLYSQFEVQRGMPIQLLMKYFTQVNETWQISPQIRAMVKLRPLNLLENLSGIGSFDIVFCRNVLIYFDNPTKKSVLEKIARLMPPDGKLFLGGAETVIGVTNVFRPVPGQRGLYELTAKDAK